MTIHYTDEMLKLGKFIHEWYRNNGYDKNPPKEIREAEKKLSKLSKEQEELEIKLMLA